MPLGGAWAGGQESGLGCSGAAWPEPLFLSCPPVKLTEPSILCIQVFGTEFCKPLQQVPRPEGDGQSPPGAKKSLDNTAAAPLGIPVPVAPGNRPAGSTAKVGAGQAAVFLLLPLPAG